MTAETRTAGRSGYDCAALDKSLDIALFHSFEVNLVGCGNNYRAYVGIDLSAFEHFRSLFEVAESAVGARADDYLVDCDIFLYVFHSLGIGGKMRESYRRTDSRQINIDYLFVSVVIARLEFVESLSAGNLYVFLGNIVYGEYAVFRAAFYSHIADGESVVHSHIFYAFACKFY